MNVSNEEEWKETKGYEEYFLVSNFGRIFSKRTDKLLTLTKLKNGYLSFSTRLDGRNCKAICLKVHRLVAENFVKNPDNKIQVNHIDGNKTNNMAANLEWCTNSENRLHAIEKGLVTFKKRCEHKNSKLSEEDVEYIRANFINGHRKFGARALARKFQLHKNTIISIVNNVKYINTSIA